MDTDIFSFIRGLGLVGPARVDDDFVDRLNYHYTFFFLILFTALISAKQYMGKPLQCWIPKHYPKSWGKYAENYCWVKNTYFVKDDIPAHPHDRSSEEIGYYQWVPIVLALQAFLFYLPTMVWRLANWQAGINVQKIVLSACTSASSVDPEERMEAVKLITSHLFETVKLSKDSKNGFQYTIKRTFFCMCGNQKFGNFLTILYVVVKLLFCANILLQFYILNAFLGTGDFFGLTLLEQLVVGREWHESGIFPRVTFCDFKMRGLAQFRPQTIQCVLPINLFNEKIYIFLWFWFLLVAILTFVNTLWWIYRSINRGRPKAFLKRYLKLMNIDAQDHEIRDLIDEKLLYDGIFVLRLISTNAGSQITSEIIKEVWDSKTDQNNKARD